MRRRNHQLDLPVTPKYKYSFNDKTYDLHLSNNSLDNKIGSHRARPPPSLDHISHKIKSDASFTLEQLLTKGKN